MAATSPDLSTASRGIYLRLSLTSACDLQCAYCRPASLRGRREPTQRPPSNDELLALVSSIAATVPVRKVRLTGGEPLLRRGVVDLVAGLRGLLPEATLAMTTNGQRLAELALPLRDAGLARLNVSLDALDEERFARLSPTGRLGATLEGIDAAVRAGFDQVKINTVLLRTVNGDRLGELVRFAAAHGAEIRFIELMPIGAGAPLYADEYLSSHEALARLKTVARHLGPLGFSGTARRHAFDVDGRRVVVGFISPVSHPFCDGCDRLRIDARGRLVGCLRDDDGIDLLAGLRAGRSAWIAEQVRDVLAGKGREATRWPARTMYGIGG
ncbi:MAG: GTP 3',8-cyclase MoaA [Acidobacteriota bacterium]